MAHMAMCDLLWSDPDDRMGWGISPRGAGYTYYTCGPGHLGALKQRQRPQVHYPCAPGGEAKAAASGWVEGRDLQGRELSCIQQVGTAAVVEMLVAG